MNTDVTLQQELRLATIVALGGLVACALVVLRDPVARANCLRVAHDPRVRQSLVDAAKRVGRETTAEIEKRV